MRLLKTKKNTHMQRYVYRIRSLVNSTSKHRTRIPMRQMNKSIPHHNNPCTHFFCISPCVDCVIRFKIHTNVWNCVQFTFVPSSQLTQKSTETLLSALIYRFDCVAFICLISCFSFVYCSIIVFFCCCCCFSLHFPLYFYNLQ